MPKQKTHKGLSKRVKVTACGKIKHMPAGAGHLMSGKDAKRRRRLHSPSVFFETMARSARIKLGK